MTKLFTLISGLAALCVVVLLIVMSYGLLNIGNLNFNVSRPGANLPTFASCSDLTSKIGEGSRSSILEKSLQGGVRFFDPSSNLGLPTASEGAAPHSPTAAAPDYSSTNVQVQGVDESDIVKTDGNYIYTISNEMLIITQAYPIDKVGVVSTTGLDDLTPREIFIHEDRLMVFGSRSVTLASDTKDKDTKEKMAYPRSSSVTSVELWNIEDRKNPRRVRVSDFEGDFVTGRKIDADVYFVVDHYAYTNDYREPVPMFRDQTGRDIQTLTGELAPIVNCTSVHYFEPIWAESFITIASIPMDDDDGDIEKNVTLGSGRNVYASFENLFIAETDYGYSDNVVIQPLQEILPGDVLPERVTKTVVHKFGLNKGNITYRGNADAPGTILNQFSMDEHKEHFRIATTRGSVSRSGGNSTNNVYIFDKDLNRVGALEDLAPGEEIYSSRFMGDRGYLVTFKKVDPLFALDLSDPKNPRVLGKLKIPGYSDYLHPYDENHIIGIGKDTVEAEEGDFAWYQGLKIALFDVTDPTDPKQKAVEIIGDRGTDSPVLDDHKALLFDRERNLFVIPVLLAEIDDSLKTENGSNSRANSYGDYTYQGAYVYDLTIYGGFNLRGRVTHVDDPETFLKSGYYYASGEDSVERSLFIGDALYTISDQHIKVNTLDDLSELADVRLYEDADGDTRDDIEFLF